MASFTVPCLCAYPVQALRHGVGVPLLLVIARDQASRALRDFTPDLHPHRPLREGSNQGLQSALGAVPCFVTRVIGVHAAQARNPPQNDPSTWIATLSRRSRILSCSHSGAAATSGCFGERQARLKRFRHVRSTPITLP